MSVLEKERIAVPAHRWWFPTGPSARVAVLRVLVYLFVIFDVFEVVNDVVPHAKASQALYRPILMREWLHLPTPNPAYAETLRAVIVVGCLLAATGRLPRLLNGLAGIVVAAAFTDWVSIGMSYSKIDHDHFALIVALWVLPTVGIARFRDRFRSEAAGWALLCIQIGCVATYFLSALAKIRYGGWDWVTGSTFAWAVTRRGTSLGDLFLNPPWILTLAQFGIFAMELSTPLLLVLRADGRTMISKRLALPPRTAARVSASIPAAVAFAHPDRRVAIEASFTSGDGGPALRTEEV